MPDPTTITATLEHIRWSNGDGFLIGSFFSESQKTFTAVGSILNAQTDMDYELSGDWTNHPKFGRQFKDEDGIYRYLVRTAKVKDEYRDKLEKFLQQQVKDVKEMYAQILKRLPDVNVRLKGDV